MNDFVPAKKSLGQHWLSDPASLASMAEAAALKAGDTVLEIGPGLGTLTEVLLNKGSQVIALEFDQNLIPDLITKFIDVPPEQLVLQQGDIRTYDFTGLPDSYKIVANIPYYLTSHLIQTISETTNPPSQAVLLVQKEVAERVAAGPGDMSLLSATAQFYWQVRLGREVPARLFSPPPKVDSQILIMERRREPLFTDVDSVQFFRLVKAGFAQRRKTLLNSLSAGLHLSREEVENICRQAGIDPKRRAQTLSLQEWHELYNNLTR
jgi:16S rRNA (adenine1518-N6/adenine1519-N6)-dimethyltransferase